MPKGKRVTFTEALRGYSKQLERRGGKKHKSTVLHSIRRMVRMAKVKYLHQMTLAKLEAVLDKLMTPKFGDVSASTINHYIGYIKSLYRWAELSEIIESCPFRAIKNRKGPIRRRRQSNSPEEMQRILEAARRGHPYEFPAMMLGFGAGLRQNEILRLRWGDLDLNRGLYVLIDSRQKSGRDSVTAIQDVLLSYLRDLRDQREKRLGRPVDPDELVIEDAPKSGKTLSAHRKATLARAGVPYSSLNGEVCDWHSMRHSFITALPCDIRTKQLLARHANIATTARYDHVNLDRQREGLGSFPSFVPKTKKKTKKKRKKG